MQAVAVMLNTQGLPYLVEVERLQAERASPLERVLLLRIEAEQNQVRLVRRGIKCIQDKTIVTYSHTTILRAAAAFGGYPINILCRIFDVTSFAVNTVRGINL